MFRYYDENKSMIKPLIMIATIIIAVATALPFMLTHASAQAPGQIDGLPGKLLIILEGASVQGNPNYEPSTITIKKGDKITVTNKDTALHTVTSGTRSTDPNSGKQFDTSFIKAGATAEIVTANLNPGQYPFFCSVHPFMTGKLLVQ